MSSSRGMVGAVVRVVLLLVIPVAGLWYAEARRSSEHLEVGHLLPPVSLVSFPDQRPVELKLERPTVIVVFSASCPFCGQQLARVDSLERKFRGRVDFLAVSMSGLEQTRQLLADVNSPSQVLLAHRENVWSQWRVKTVPTVFLTDHRGALVMQWSGLKESEEEGVLIERLSQTLAWRSR